MRARRFPLVLPTASSVGLLFLFGAMWYAGASQGNAAAYLLLFALMSVALVAIPHTWFNLSGLRAGVESIKPAFAGQEVLLPVEVLNASRSGRYGISVHVPEHEDASELIDEIQPGRAARLVLRFPASARGEYQVEVVCLSSVYPLGFLRARKRIAAAQRYIVYPKPAGDPALPAGAARSTPDKPRAELGEGDDFAGVRAYVPGESQRHIDWKAVARGQAMMTKQFTTEPAGQLYLDFAAARFSATEARLSQLALWVIEAERARRPYGLRLPGVDIPPALGDIQFRRCLRALALF